MNISTLPANQDKHQGSPFRRNLLAAALSFAFAQGPTVMSVALPAFATAALVAALQPGAAHAATVSTLAGAGGGYADDVGAAARFDFPFHLAVDAAGNVYVADYNNNRIRKINPSTRAVTTLAGDGTAGYLDGDVNTARFTHPTGVAVGADGSVYVADYNNSLIRKINTVTNVVSTLAGGGAPNGTSSGYVNDTGRAAMFSAPRDIAVDASNIYVADTGNNRIRKIVIATGVVTTLAGSGVAGYLDDAGTTAQFNAPYSVAVDATGSNLYVADQNNNLIRKIVIATGAVTTLAGGGSNGGTASGHIDATGTAATFNMPLGVAVDAGGNVYVAEYSNNSIRKITPGGVVSTLAGPAGGTSSGYTNGIGTAARFNHPYGVAVDTNGNVYVADTTNNLIRKIAPDASLVSSVPADNAVNITPGATIALTFSDAMTVGSGNLKIVNDTDSTTETIDVAAPAGKFAWTVGGTVLTITPGTALVAGKSYHIEIEATAFVSGSKVYPGISDSTTLNFTMDGPAFSSITPAASTYIKAAGTIGYTLSKTVASGSITFTRTGGAADNNSPETCTLQGTARNTGAGRTVGLTSNEDGCTTTVTLVDGAIYTIALSGTDAVPLTGTASIAGVTYDATLPARHATTPITAAKGAGKTGAGYEATDIITIKFTEPVATANITAGNIAPSAGTLDNPTVAAVGASGGYADTYTVTLGASPTVVADATLTITAANVVDRAGNQAAGAAIFTLPSFVIVPGSPTIGTATAGNGSATVAFTAPENNGGADITEYTASCQPTATIIIDYRVPVVVSGSANLDRCRRGNHFSALYPSATGTGSPITVTGLTNGTAYKCEVKAKNSTGYGNYSNYGNEVTPTAPASSGGDYTPPPNPNIIPTGGGTATLTGGQSVTVTENGKDGTGINLPPPSTGTAGANPGSNSINVTLPGTGQIGVSSDSKDTQLGVTHVTLPGTTTSVSTVTVDQGSASFTATQSGQAVAGLKNGIVVVSGSKDSQVSVDATGPNATIGVKSSDTIIVPTGSANVSGTKVDLPSPTASGGAASTVSLNIGGQELTIQSSQANTTMTFQVVNIGGVQTPVLAVTGNAQVSSSGEDKPIVSIAGNVIKTGKSGGGSKQVCNTIVQASSDTSSDVVHVVTCYIVLEAGSFSAMGGGGGTGNSFAAIKDGIVWAGETAEFDKNGKVTSAYLGSRSGDTAAVGDDMAPGGAKFAAAGYKVGAFIPRLAGTPLRLNGAKLDESIFGVVNKTLGVTTQPALPAQSDQGVLNFTFAGNLANQGVQSANVAYTINTDTASVMPSRRIRVDTSRADGISISAEGDVDVATGGLVTTFTPSVADPKAFADRINQVLPGSTSILRWNGTWQVTAADGTTYVGRSQWSHWAAAPGAAMFSTTADGNVLFSDNGRAQALFPDFFDYDALQATFRAELKDPTLTVLPRMDGTATATVNGQTYTLAPQWNLIKPAAGKPAWWVEGSVVYIKNSDGSAQGFTVK